MAKDMRHYAKFTYDFPDNHKILPLSDAAFRCLVEATIWSCEHQSDGRLPTRLALARWSLENLNELCDNDPDHPSLLRTDEGWIIRDFAEHQDTKAEIRARRERAIIAGQKGGIARAKQFAKRTAKQSPKQSSSGFQATKAKAKTLLAPTGLAGLGDAPRSANGAAHHPNADEAIRLCRLCDDRGYIGLRAGPFVTCPHNPKQIQQLENQYENADAE